MAGGKLYIVATPIGNPADMTLRAAKILASVGCIACEDTRETAKLLKEAGVSNRLFAYHDFNKEEASANILKLLSEGTDVAVVSDAGTPCISDPGYLAVRKARHAGFEVVPVPGPSALTAALSVSGFATDTFMFQGFLNSRSAGKRDAKLKELLAFNVTVILYEAPHRVLRLLGELEAIAPDMEIFIGREMTKRYEQFLTGTPASLKQHFEISKPLGEFVVVLNKRPEKAENVKIDAMAEYERLVGSGIDGKTALKELAGMTGISRNDLYAMIRKKPRSV